MLDNNIKKEFVSVIALEREIGDLVAMYEQSNDRSILPIIAAKRRELTAAKKIAKSGISVDN